MGSLSPNDRARERASINVKLVALLGRRERACTAIADALVEIATVDTMADGLLDDLAAVNRPNPGILSGQ